jgi:molybdate transport system ATP-binding protein
MTEFSLQKKLHAVTGNMLFDVSFNIQEGSFIGIYGASGAGKTSLLRMLAGFLAPEKGFIKVNGSDWYNSQKKINLAPQKRRIGFVFQDYALFPNMTVKENLVFALDKTTNPSAVEELLSFVELEQFKNRKIQTLSGGQKQRVALARALVRKPDLLLLDEPLSALDTELREKLQTLILQIHRQFNLTTILVSHDISEMIRLADEIIFLKDGLVEKSGSPAGMFAAQKSKDEMRFQGIVMEKPALNSIYLLIGKEIIEFELGENEITHLQKGDTVLVSIQTSKTYMEKIK